MIRIGNFNRLMILERSEAQVFLDGGRDGKVILAANEAPPDALVGSMLNVFVYVDATQQALLATIKKPLAQVGEFAYLRVSAIQPVGVFLDWGLPKELFLPFREQTRELKVGDYATVYVYLDSSSRVSASMRVDKYLDKNPGAYREGDKVELLIFASTDLGLKAIINGRHLGVIYRNEIFQPIKIGQKVSGYISKLREDGKIDLSLQQAGYRACGDVSKKIIMLLGQRGGFLPVTDKSSVEAIYQLFGVSKKKYKMAVGSLYKKQQIRIAEDGIHLSSPARRDRLN